MRLVQLLLALFLAAFVQAALTPTPYPTPTAPPTVREVAAPEKRLFGICILGINILGDCSPRTSTTTTTSSSSTRTSSITGTPTSSPSSSATPTDPSSLGGTNNGGFATSVNPYTFSYSQPPIPARTVSAPSAVFTATDGGYISSLKRTRYYTFNMAYGAGAPNGVLRRMTVINNQFPAPLIEANQGDTLVITVNNNLDHPQALHWHGIRQNGTNSEDGVPGVSQCPIPAGGSYTYRFTLESEYGTYWYHSHYGNTLADGVVGAIVVHAQEDPIKKFTDFDEERVMYVSDWMNDQSDLIVEKLHDVTEGYRGVPIPSNPDSLLINGIGEFDCRMVQAGVKCTPPKQQEIRVVSGRKVRFRMINTGAHALIRMSIDKHPLKVVEVDDTPIKPIMLNEISIWPGQRYSVIVEMNKGNIGDAFAIRARMAGACGVPPASIRTTAKLIYTGILGLTWFGDLKIKDQPWPDLADEIKAPCKDMDEIVNLEPLVREDPPAVANGVSTWNSQFGVFTNIKGGKYIGFGYNGTEFTNYINKPLLDEVMGGRELDPTHLAAITWRDYGAYDLIINQRDPSPLAHPFHLHGRPFHILARGKGTISSGDLAFHDLKIDNPIRRDTLAIDGDSWVVLRVHTDTPGVWPLHCHIGWHLAVGKLGVIVIRPDAIKNQNPPAAWRGLCAGTDPNEIGPGRRRGFVAGSPIERRHSHRRGREQALFSQNGTDWRVTGSH